MKTWVNFQKKNMGSVICLYTLVLLSVPEIEGIYATGIYIYFLEIPLVEFVYPVNYSHARWSYGRQFRSLLLLPLSVEYC